MMSDMNTIVVAYDRLRTIGRNNQLPWQGKMPADMAHFKSVTEGRSVVMGRKTFDSLPERYRPLPRRHNIILSLSQTAIDGVTIAHSLEEAYAAADRDAYVIGGAQVYDAAMAGVDRIIATEIDTLTVGGDTFFPEINTDEWTQSEKISFDADQQNAYSYSFVTYLRRHY
jgi:dihydrofolate reductase